VDNLGMQSKILMKHITDLYNDKDFEGLSRLYDSLDIDQTFVMEVLQEMEILYTSSKSKKTKKSFDKLKPKTKGAFTKFWKAHVKGTISKDGFKDIKNEKKNRKKKQKVKLLRLFNMKGC
jgi:hypothetical protein